MSIPSNPPVVSSMKIFARAASAMTILVGSLVLLGWMLDIPTLKSIIPHLATMKANTAMAFVIAGLALWLLLKEPATQLERHIVRVCALVVALLGLLTLCEYSFGWQLGIDQWLFKDFGGGASNLTPGRMSPTTAMNFLLLGTAFLLLERGTPLGDRLAHSLGSVVILFSGLALLGYLYGATTLYGIGAYNQIAVHTALIFIIATAGLLCVHPDRGLMTTITSKNAGSFTARRLLPVAIVLPVALGWLRLQAQQAGWNDLELGQAIVVSSNIVVIVGIILWNARLLNQTDAELKFAQAADLRQSEERLRYVTWATRDAVWDRNVTTGAIWWNESLQKLLHYPADQVEPNVTWWEQHIHPEDRDKVIRSIQRIFETKQYLWSKEYRFQRADGSYANIFDRGYVLYDEQTGQPQRMIGAMTDITEQKQIEQELLQSQELFTKAFSASPAGITMTRKADGKVIEVNNAYLKMVGYSRSEILGKTTLELGAIIPEDGANILKMLNDQGSIRDFEIWVRTKSGLLKAVLSSFEQVEIGGDACILSIVYDITERKQTEAALRESEQKFRSVIEQSADGIVLIDEEGKIIEWNKSQEEITGLVRADTIGQFLWDVQANVNKHLLEPAIYERNKMAIHDLLSTGEASWLLQPSEYEIQNTDGTRRTIQMVTFPIKVNKGFIACSIARDITQRKQSEEALQQSETLFRALFELSPDSVVIIDPHDPNISWPIIDCNAATCLMNGYERDELIGHSIDILNGTVGTADERQAYIQSLREKGSIQAEFQHQHKNGLIFPIETSTTLIMIGERELIIGIDRDITARKRVEQALAQEQYLLISLLENAPDHIYFKDTQSRFIRISAAHAKIFGLSNPADAIGKTDFDFFTEEHARLAYDDEQEIMSSGQPITKEERETWPDRPDTWVIATKMPLRNQSGEIIGTFGISTDITRRKQAEDELHDKNEDLTRGLAEVDQRNREIMLLNELGNLLQSCQTPDEAYTVIGQSVPKIFPHSPGALYMINASRNIVEAVAAWKTLSIEEHTFAPDDCMALRRGRPHFVAEYHSGLQCKHVVGAPAAYICVPMMAQGEALGIFHLQVMQSEAPKGSKPFEQGLVETVADTIGLALTNLKLRETLRKQSIRDPLTDLFNRRFMEESLEREIHRATRNQRSLGIVMLDIDHFKNFNDTFGHEAGDAVLRELGDFLKQHIRGGDIACRYGGEEFLLLLPEASLDATRHRAQKLCDEVRQLQIQYRGETLKSITLSLGVAVFPEHGQEAKDVVRAADAALYNAKQEGRNRVAVADSV
jgi:diguanylate cyclase (GGDEF)-like protein/PAS domain S-box-containing protein